MFKNLIMYRLTSDIGGPGKSLETRSARSPGLLEMNAIGWGKVCPKSDMLIHNLDGCSILCLEKRERILPGSVVNDEINLRSDKIEEEEGRSVTRRERANIKDDALAYLLPKAFIKTSRTMVLIDHEAGLIIVDTSSPGKAESVLSLLRETLGGLPMIFIETTLNPRSVLTSKVESDSASKDWAPGLDHVLCDPANESGVMRIRNIDQTMDEIKSHRDAGRQVKESEFVFKERLNFIITDDLRVKRIQYLDIVQDARNEADYDDEQSRFDSDMHIMIGELRMMISAMIHMFGGEVDRISKAG